jgi:hypothetical protein
MRIKCKTVLEGPGPFEAIVAIGRSDGREEEVVVPREMIENDTLRVGRVAEKQDSILIELPIESAFGNWRIWVNSSSVAAMS